MAGGLGVSPSGVLFTSRPIPLRIESRGSVAHFNDSNSNFKDRARLQKPYLIADPNLSIIEIEAALRESVRNAYKGLQQAFQSFDVNQSLSITKGEFRRVLETVCFPMTTEQFGAIANKIQSNPNGTINYLDFLEKFWAGSRPNSVTVFEKSQRRSRIQSPKDISTDMLEKMLKEKIAQNMKNVYHAMRLHDYNNDGHIQKHELRRVLENTCFKISDAQFDKLYNRYDFRHRGVLDYNEFLVRLGLKSDKPVDQTGLAAAFSWQEPNKKNPFVLPQISKPENAATACLNLDQVENIFRKKLHENMANIKKMFLAFDKHLDGFLNLNDLKSVLCQFTLPLTEKQFIDLMDRFGFKASGKIPWQHFLNKFVHSQASKNGQAVPTKADVNKCRPGRGQDQGTTLEGLLRLLHEHVTNHKSSYREIFLELDKNRQGNITHNDLTNVIKSFKLRVSGDMLKELFALLDPENSNKISYHKFLDLFEPRESLVGHKWLSSSHRFNDQQKPVILAWKTVESIMKEQIQAKWKEFSEALLKGDSEEIGKISGVKMKKILEKYTIPISQEHFNELAKRCREGDGDDKVDYIELLLQLGVVIKPGDLQGVSTKIHDASQEAEDKRMAEFSMRQNQLMRNLLGRTVNMSTEEVMTRLRDHLTQKTPLIRNAFMKYDRHNKGKVSKQDFKAMLESVGFYMTKEQFDELWSGLGLKNGHLDYMQFVEKFEDPRIGGPAESLLKPSAHRVNPIRGDDKLMTAEVAETKLRSKLITHYEDLRGAFNKFCHGDSPVFGRKELRQLLDSFICPMDKEEFNKLCDSLGLGKSTKLSYPEFLDLFDIRDTKEGHPWLNSEHRYNPVKPAKGMKAEEVHKILATKAHMKYGDLAKAFTRIDSSAEGVITKKRLKETLSLFMIPVEKEEFDKLWQRYDSGSKGHLSHSDFLQHLMAEQFSPGDKEGTSKKIQVNSYHTLEKHHQTQLELHEKNTHNQAAFSAELSADEILAQLNARINDQFSDLRSAFKAIDTRHKDYLTSNDFQKLLVSYNYVLDDDQYYDFLQRLGLSSPKSGMTYHDFCEVFEENKRAVNSPSQEDVLYPPVKYENLSNEDAEAKIQQKVIGQTDVLQKAFQAFDQHSRGMLPMTDFRSVINNFCFKLTNSQFKHLASKLQTVDDMVVYSSFLDNFSNASQNYEEVLAEVRKQLEPEVPAPLSNEEVLSLITENVAARFDVVARAFAKVDYARIGVVSKEDFKNILFQHLLRVNEEQFEKLWQQLPINEFGNLQYELFMRQYGREPSRPDTSMSRSSLSRASLRSSFGRPFTPMVNAEGVENQMHQKIRFQWKEIQKMCRFADPNNSGKIPPNAIKAILSNCNIRLPLADLDTLLLKYDLHNDGQFCYKEFLRHFVISMDSHAAPKTSRGKLPTVPTSEKIHNDSLTRLQRGVSLHWRQMRQELTQLDQDCSGGVTPLQLRQVFKKYGINLTEDEFLEVVLKYDEDQNGQVNYNSLIKSVLKSLG